MKRLAALFVTLALGGAACSSGPVAPPIVDAETVCTDTFCIDVPTGWSVEVGAGYISANHEVLPSGTYLTAGIINLEAIVTSAGGSWPASTREVSRAFWSLLEEAGVGSFSRSQRVVGGAERSWGVHDDGTMWHLVHPTGASSGIGIEMRAPNDTWEAHADFVFASIRILR